MRAGRNGEESSKEQERIVEDNRCAN